MIKNTKALNLAEIKEILEKYPQLEENTAAAHTLQYIEKFVKMKFVKKVLGIGKEKATIIHDSGIQVDVRVFTEKEFGAGLLYFTGDKQHNIWLRKIAIKKGWKLNEYGLFEGTRRIAGKTEEEIYSKLGVNFVEPEKRIGEIR